eukprot:g5276.t1
MASTSLLSKTIAATRSRVLRAVGPAKRTGLVAVKCGMMPVWDDEGIRRACTVLEVQDCQVITQKTIEKDGYSALQLGAGWVHPKQVKKPQAFHYLTRNIPIKRKLQEFRVSEENLLDVGTELRADHFEEGAFVDVCGTSIGKGFQGVMKRHNFGGQPATHGASKSHRSIGSIGGCQDPGKVWKGQKMPGRMGNERVTTQSLHVEKIDPENNLIYVRGSVPGHKGNFVRITDATRVEAKRAAKARKKKSF